MPASRPAKSSVTNAHCESNSSIPSEKMPATRADCVLAVWIIPPGISVFRGVIRLT